jgi:hypothetical protein
MHIPRVLSPLLLIGAALATHASFLAQAHAEPAAELQLRYAITAMAEVRGQFRSTPQALEAKDQPPPKVLDRPVTALVAWDRSYPAAEISDCDGDRMDLFDTFKLGEAAVSKAKADSSPAELRSVLHLAQALESCGHLMHILMGLDLSQRALDAVPPGLLTESDLERYRPQEEQIDARVSAEISRKQAAGSRVDFAQIQKEITEGIRDFDEHLARP